MLSESILLDVDDFVFLVAVRCGKSHDFAGLFAQKSFAQKRFVADFAFCKVRFRFAHELNGHNSVVLVVEFAEIFDGDDVADRHLVVAALFNDDGVF